MSVLVSLLASAGKVGGGGEEEKGSFVVVFN